MVIATANYSTSFDAFDFSALLLAEDHTKSSSLYEADYGDFAEKYTGSNLQYDWTGLPKSGTITGYQSVSDDHGTVLTITGLSISAAALGKAAKSVTDLSDDHALVKTIFAGDDQITGSRYVDQLNGYAGNDVINGGRGSDILTGGSGADTFVFTKGSKVDVITDFTADNTSASHDLIDLSGYSGIDDFSDLSIHRVGGHLVIDLGSDEIVLKGVKLAAIDAHDFIF